MKSKIRITGNRTVIGIICIVLALGITFGIAPLVNRFTDRKVEVVQVKQNVERGHLITEDDVELVKVGALNLSDRTVKNKKYVVGKYAATNLYAGQIMIADLVAEKSNSADNVLSALDGTKVAISVNIASFAQGLSNKLQNGDIVSVIVYDKETNQSHVPPELRYDELAGAFVRMYHTLRQNEHGILDQAVLQLQSYKAKRTCQNEQIAGIDADIARLSEQSEMYAKLLAEKVIDQVTYAEKCDIYKRKISELRTRRRKLLSEDEDERCVEGLRELKRKLHDMPPRIFSATKNQITAITKKIYAEEDGSLTFVLCGELELNVRMETLCH